MSSTSTKTIAPLPNEILHMILQYLTHETADRTWLRLHPSIFDVADVNRHWLRCVWDTVYPAAAGQLYKYGSAEVTPVERMQAHLHAAKVFFLAARNKQASRVQRKRDGGRRLGRKKAKRVKSGTIGGV